MGRGARDSDGYAVSKPSGEVIFSFVDGFVWLSWPGAVSAVRVGEYQAVTDAMRDFLSQCEIGDRLVNGTSKSARSAIRGEYAGLNSDLGRGT